MANMTKKTETIWNRNFTCVFIANFLLSLQSQCVNPLISVYVGHLGAGPILIGTLTGVYFAVAFAVRPITGPMTARLDNRKLMILVNILGVFANLGYAFTNTVGAFMALRILSGLQYGLVGSLYLTIASDSLPLSKLGSGISIYAVGLSFSQAVGPALGTSIREMGIKMGNEALSYRIIFIAAASFMALALIPSFAIKLGRKTKEELEAAGVWYKNIVAVRALPAAVIMVFVLVSVQPYSAYLVPYADMRGVKNIGLFFTVSAIIILCVRPIYGKLGERFGLKKVLIPGLLLLIISFVLVSRAKTLPAMLVVAVLSALGNAGAYPGLQAMGMQAVRRQKHGAASNTVFFGVDLGFFLGPLLGGVVYSFSDYPTMYLAAIVPCVLAVILLILFWPAFTRWKAEAESGQG